METTTNNTKMIERTKEQLAMDLLDTLTYFETGNNMRKSMLKVIVQSVMDLETSHIGIEDDYFSTFGFLFLQMDKMCDILDEYNTL